MTRTHFDVVVLLNIYMFCVSTQTSFLLLDENQNRCKYPHTLLDIIFLKSASLKQFVSTKKRELYRLSLTCQTLFSRKTANQSAVVLQEKRAFYRLFPCRQQEFLPNIQCSYLNRCYLCKFSFSNLDNMFVSLCNHEISILNFLTIYLHCALFYHSKCLRSTHC